MSSLLAFRKVTIKAGRHATAAAPRHKSILVIVPAVAGLAKGLSPEEQ
jgi:hypothetical protein